MDKEVTWVNTTLKTKNWGKRNLNKQTIFVVISKTLVANKKLGTQELQKHEKLRNTRS